MRLHLLGMFTVIAAATNVSAQFRGGSVAPPPRGAPTPHGGFRMVQAPPLPRTSGFGLGVGLGTGYGSGGFITGGYGYLPYYAVPQPVPVPVVVGGTSIPAAPSGATAVSGVLPATLVIEYPAAAKVWLNGVAVPGEADITWSFTSRDLRPGETATFRVRGRWVAGGKTFESEREVPLGPGARSRLLVVSGTEVRE